MKRGSPSVALIWVYQGKQASSRLAEIQSFDYPEFKVVRGMREVPKDTDVCVFWVDDDKPVGKDFLKQMTQPLIASAGVRAVMHFWSGNALSIPKAMVEGAGLDDEPHDSVHPLLRLLLPVLDSAEPRHGRLHLAFSSTERLAPLALDAVGIPS